MYQPGRRNRGDYVPSVDAEISRAERRRIIVQAVEKRLDDLHSAALLPDSGALKEPVAKLVKRKRSARVASVL